MVCEVEACTECTQNCLLIHGKNKNPDCAVPSFFKIMIGDDFSDVLFLSPVFARTISALVEQKIHLEDSSGRQWKVKLTNFHGSLAIQQGWHAFSLDHGLEIGDFLVFHYIMGSHFVVKIYGRSGCEKRNVYCNRKKRNRTNRNFIAKGGLCHTANKGSVGKQGSGASAVSVSDIGLSQSQPMTTANTSTLKNGNGKIQHVSRTQYIEEPFYMIDIDARYKQGEDGFSLFDLSSFEMQRDKFGADGSAPIENEKSHVHADAIPRPHTEGGLLVNEDLVTEGVENHMAPSDVPGVSMIEKSNNSLPMDKMVFMSENDAGSGTSTGHLLETPVVTPLKNRNNREDMSNVVAKCQNVEQRSTQHSRKRMKIIKKKIVESSEETFGTEPKIIKECGQFSCPAVKDIFQAVKVEPFDSIDFSPVADNISCLMMATEFLELPRSLTSRKMRTEKTVVHLRGPDTRLWAVMYYEKCGIKVLTSGWDAFSKANGINLGDTCVFGVENRSEYIFRVTISRN